MYRHLFCFLFCNILLVTCENVHHWKEGERKLDRQTSEADDFESFKKVVLRELREMKNREMKMEKEILQLKMEIVAKDRNIEELEKGQGHTAVKGRRQLLENVAFTAYLDHSVHNLSQDQPIIYNKVLLNDGNGYDIQTGMFRAPVSGVYLFSYSVGAKTLPGVHLRQYDVFTRLMIDGAHQLSAVAESTDVYDDEQGSTTAVVYVEEASTVWTKHEYKGGNNLFSLSNERVTSFTGALLYEKEPAIDSGIIG